MNWPAFNRYADFRKSITPEIESKLAKTRMADYECDIKPFRQRKGKRRWRK